MIANIVSDSHIENLAKLGEFMENLLIERLEMILRFVDLYVINRLTFRQRNRSG